MTPRLPAAPPGTFWQMEGYRGDFDGDGDTDLIVAHQDPYSFLGMRLFKNTGGGAFVDGGYALPAGTGFVLARRRRPGRIAPGGDRGRDLRDARPHGRANHRV